MRKTLIALGAAVGGLWMWRRTNRTTGPKIQPPGRRKRLDTLALEAGAALLQGKSPLWAMNLYLNGFHFYSDDMGHQMEAHHFCCRVNEDLMQCVIFDGNTRDARLVGVEYIVSERLFKTLPDEERRLWHSHHYEVQSGTLIAPGIPEPVQRKLMEQVVSTYGKVWHTWDTTQDELPMGIPSLMMGFTADGQLQPQLEQDRDQRFGISTRQRRMLRRGIPMPRLVPGANAWESGRTSQLTLSEMNQLRPGGGNAQRPI